MERTSAWEMARDMEREKQLGREVEKTITNSHHLSQVIIYHSSNESIFAFVYYSANYYTTLDKPKTSNL